MKTFYSLLLLFLNFTINAQTTPFKSDNGFSGTFEIGKDQKLEPGSVLIEQFRTSVGVFSGNDLISYGVVFPYRCLECTFEIIEIAAITKVNRTQGAGFETVVKAAKNYVLEERENKKLAELVVQIKDKRTLNDQLKIAYGAFPSFQTKGKLDDLISKIKNGEFLLGIAATSDSPAPKVEPQGPIELDTVSNLIIEEEPIIAPKVEDVVTIEHTQDKDMVEQRIEIHDVDEEDDEKKMPQDTIAKVRYKNIKCVKTIEKLEMRLKEAREQNDYLIINEVEKALEKQYKKCAF